MSAIMYLLNALGILPAIQTLVTAIVLLVLLLIVIRRS
jgi:hypothetical protein